MHGVEGYDKVTCKAFFTIFGGWCILLIIGAQLAWGNQSTYIASYYHHLGYQVRMDQFYVVQPLIVSIATLFFPIGMHYSQTRGSKPTLLMGGAASLGMVWICSMIKNPTWFIWLYSIGFGASKGLMYSSALAAGWSHLPGRKGLASGVITCGFGFGGFIFGIVTNRLCNPHNIRVQSVDYGDGTHPE